MCPILKWPHKDEALTHSHTQGDHSYRGSYFSCGPIAAAAVGTVKGKFGESLSCQMSVDGSPTPGTGQREGEGREKISLTCWL